jgi:AcrR family transcriptional regulator
VTERLPAARRRRQLLDVAISVFAAHGYHQTTMNQVAEAAGVTKPVLYQHFTSKQELFAEVLRDLGGQLEEVIGKATSTATSPRNQVRAGFVAYFRFVTEERDALELLFGADSRQEPEFVQIQRSLRASIAEATAALIDVEGLDRDDRRFLAQGIVGIAEATSRHWLVEGGGGDPEVVAEAAADLAWGGLRGIRRTP